MRMLGRYRLRAYRFDGAKWRWIRLDGSRKTKYRKLAEKHRWQREAVEETNGEPEADSVVPFEDLSDCVHGCNGDCETSGSDRCTFTCHSPQVSQFWRDLEANLEKPRFRRSYIRQSLKIQKANESADVAFYWERPYDPDVINYE